MNPLCVCGHDEDAHEHYRAGNDCGACGCPGWRRSRKRRGKLWSWRRKSAAAREAG